MATSSDPLVVVHASVTATRHRGAVLDEVAGRPAVDLLLYRAAGRNLAAIDALQNYLENYLSPTAPRLVVDEAPPLPSLDQAAE